MTEEIKQNEMKTSPETVAEPPKNGTSFEGVRLGRNFPIFLLLFFILAFIVVSPLLHGLAWGVLLAFFGFPVKKLVNRSAYLARSPNLSTAATMTVLLFLFMIPLIFVLQAAGHELFNFYIAFSGMDVTSVGQSLFSKIVALLPDWLHARIAPLLSDGAMSLLAPLARSAASFLQNLSKGVLQWTGSFLLHATVAIMTMFFFIRDGEAIERYIEDFIPLPEAERKVFSDDARGMLRGVVYGVMLTVAVQSALAGFGWWMAGLPNVFLATAAMFVVGMLPMGTSLIWFPGAIYLIATGSTGWGIAYLAWGVVVVGSSDNILRPIFIGGGTTIPTFAIIIGVIGGLAVWGLIGVFLGPLVLALFLSVLELYRRTIKAG